VGAGHRSVGTVHPKFHQIGEQNNYKRIELQCQLERFDLWQRRRK
jgi:hypothetical protein